MIKQLYYLSNKLKVKYIHVRSHQKEPKQKCIEWYHWYGNKQADYYAKKAMKNELYLQDKTSL